jgi:hypothetical protein
MVEEFWAQGQSWLMAVLLRDLLEVVEGLEVQEVQEARVDWMTFEK